MKKIKKRTTNAMLKEKLQEKTNQPNFLLDSLKIVNNYGRRAPVDNNTYGTDSSKRLQRDLSFVCVQGFDSFKKDN